MLENELHQFIELHIMKRILIIFILAISVFGLRAQDTINPFLMDPITIPCIRDSASKIYGAIAIPENRRAFDSVHNYRGRIK